MNPTPAGESSSDFSEGSPSSSFSREQLFAFLDNAPFGFLVVDAKGVVREANLQATAIFGYTKEGLVGLKVEELMFPDAREKHVQLRAGFAAAPSARKMAENRDVLGRRLDGTLVPLEIRLNSIQLAGASYVLTCVSDISVRKATEGKVAALNAKLSESENRFEIMANGAPVMIWISDPDGKRTFFNQVWLEFRGSTMDQERQGGWLEGVHVEDRDRVAKAYLSAVAERRGYELEYRLRRGDGTYAWVFGRARVRERADGTYEGLVGCCMDISKHQQLVEEKRRLDEKLMEAAKLESLGVLAGGIAHDFNNLLTGILGNASLARLELPESHPVVETLSEIEISARRAGDLCRQMLAYSGRGRFVVKNLNLNRLVDETTHLLQISISKTCVLRFHLAENLPSISADATQLRQIVMNLVINASEAIGVRSGVVAISTGVARLDSDYIRTLRHDGGIIVGGSYVFLEVSDNGTGMGNETIDRIFDPFFTTKFSGRGLGLAAVLGIVRGHKGGIKVYSEKGKGTTFKLFFPSLDSESESAEETNSGLAATWTGTGTIMVVDDEETIRSVAGRMIERLGFRVELAADGREAVEAFKKAPSKYALILLDLTMPHLDGEETYRQLRHLNPGVRVLLTSGFNHQEAVSRFAGKGLAGFVQKPFEMSTLKDAIRQTILAT